MNTTETPTTNRPREPRLNLYHPAGNGNGAALQLAPRLNRAESDRFNCLFLDLAPQKTAPGRDGDKRVPATFDWEHRLTVKLDFADICEILMVLEGRAEKAGDPKNGIYHENGRTNTIITFQKNADKGGYLLSLSRKDKTSGEVSRAGITLSEAEALGLRYLFRAGLVLIAFPGPGAAVAAESAASA
jgi:hypothetical protein